MESDKKCSCGEAGMSCGMCGHHHWSHWVVKAAILLFVFWAGMEFGEVRALLHSDYSYRSFGPTMMGNEGYYLNVRGSGDAAPVTVTAPAGATKTAPAPAAQQ